VSRPLPFLSLLTEEKNASDQNSKKSDDSALRWPFVEWVSYFIMFSIDGTVCAK
jgi:hypothetical protein